MAAVRRTVLGAYPGHVAHRLPHELDELPHLGRAKLLGRQLSRPLPQHRLPGLDDLQHRAPLQHTHPTTAAGAFISVTPCPSGSACFAGMNVIARSASAVIVSEGLTPGFAEMAEPSITYSPS